MNLSIPVGYVIYDATSGEVCIWSGEKWVAFGSDAANQLMITMNNQRNKVSVNEAYNRAMKGIL